MTLIPPKRPLPGEGHFPPYARCRAIELSLMFLEEASQPYGIPTPFCLPIQLVVCQTMMRKKYWGHSVELQSKTKSLCVSMASVLEDRSILVNIPY